MNTSELPFSDRKIYQDIFEFSPTPTAVYDLKGRCLHANRAFYIHLGFEPQDSGSAEPIFSRLFERAEEGNQFLNEIQERTVVRRQEKWLVTQDGDGIFVLLSGRTVELGEEIILEITFIDISRQKKMERTLRKEHTRLASLIENLSAGVFLINNNGIVTDVNSALGNILGLEPDGFVSGNYMDLTGHLISLTADPDIFAPQLDRAILNVGRKPTIEFSIDPPEGLHLELTLFPVRDDTGHMLGWGGLIQDITELRNQVSWKMELISMLSHDLRSPLATLKGHASALLASHTGWSPDMVTDFLAAINRSVDQLSHQVDRNLALTRLEAGRLGLRPEAVSPAQLVVLAQERVASALEGHEVQIEAQPDLPKVRVDPNRIVDVLANLLDNAARYSPPNHPIIVKIQADEDWVHFHVADHGPGIPAEKQAEIFEKYARAESEGNGTGLGLYISRKIVEAHGGRIWLQSPPEGEPFGAVFVFSVPVMPEDLQMQSEENLIQPDRSTGVELSGDRILVVEDEPDYQVLLRSIFEEAGYEVDVAPDGGTALKTMRSVQPDLILLDWVIRDYSGLQFCRSVRRWSQVPIIMLTSRTAQEDIITAFDAGVDDYLTKPFRREELLVRIRALLRRGESWAVDTDQKRFSSNGLLIDFDLREAWLNGNSLDLTVTEYTLLSYFCRHSRQVLTYDQLIETLWPDGDGTRHGLSVHISRLRKKLESNPKDPKFIRTRWGLGYVFLPRPSSI